MPCPETGERQVRFIGVLVSARDPVMIGRLEKADACNHEYGIGDVSAMKVISLMRTRRTDVAGKLIMAEAVSPESVLIPDSRTP